MVDLDDGGQFHGHSGLTEDLIGSVGIHHIIVLFLQCHSLILATIRTYILARDFILIIPGWEECSSCKTVCWP